MCLMLANWLSLSPSPFIRQTVHFLEQSKVGRGTEREESRVCRCKVIGQGYSQTMEVQTQGFVGQATVSKARGLLTLNGSRALPGVQWSLPLVDLVPTSRI